MQENDNGEQVLCRVSDIGEGAARGLLREGEEDRIFAVRKDGQVHVYVNSCPHNGRPLEYMQDRFLSPDGSRIICYAHGAHFEIDSGLCVHGPCVGSVLESVPVRIEDGKVFIAADLARQLQNDL